MTSMANRGIKRNGDETTEKNLFLSTSEMKESPFQIFWYKCFVKQLNKVVIKTIWLLTQLFNRK